MPLHDFSFIGFSQLISVHSACPAQVDISQQWNTAFGTQSFVVQPWLANHGNVNINIGQNPQFYSPTVFGGNDAASSQVFCQPATNTNLTATQGRWPAPSSYW